jgi:hypothetical protein
MIRAFTFTVLCYVSFCLIGCKGPEQNQPKQVLGTPYGEQIKIGDISSPYSNQRSAIISLNTIDFDVHIFEVPAENADKISDLWGLLYTEPLQFNSKQAFIANSFVVRFGRIRMWNRINDLLLAAGGQKLMTVSLILPNGQVNDLTVRGLNIKQSVSYIAADGRSERAVIGPGILALRIKAEKIPNLRDVCELIAFPVFTVPAGSSIPQLFVRAKAREFSFPSVVFGLRMAPGDFLVLGPEKYNPPTADKTTLDGLFFSKPEGSLFPSTTGRIAPELKPAIRIFLIVCAGMSN